MSDFEVSGDMYKVKTWNEITKLERNGTFVYESLPGTAVNVLEETADEVSLRRWNGTDSDYFRIRSKQGIQSIC